VGRTAALKTFSMKDATMRRLTVIDLVNKHFPEAIKVTDQRIQRSLEREAAAGWHAGYLPTCRDRYRHVVLVANDDPLKDVFDSVRTDPGAMLPLSLIEHRLATRIDSLGARDKLSAHGLIIKDLSPGIISFTGACPRKARIANFPRYGVPHRGWLVRGVVPDVLGLPGCPKKLHDDRLMQTALMLHQLGIDATDLCDRRAWVHLHPAWTVAERVHEFAA
jgi:hypothetical protein